MKKLISYLLAILLSLSVCHPVFAKEAEWKLTKDEEGVKVYTRKAQGSRLQEYKGVIQVRASMEKTLNLFLDTSRVTEWTFNCKEYRELPSDGSDKKLFYYLQELPWPLADRDVVTERTESSDPGTGAVTYRMKGQSGILPVQKEIVRIDHFQSMWQFTPQADGTVQVIYQYDLDPSGSIPKWVVNRVGTEAPFQSLKQFRQMLETA